MDSKENKIKKEKEERGLKLFTFYYDKSNRREIYKSIMYFINDYWCFETEQDRNKFKNIVCNYNQDLIILSYDKWVLNKVEIIMYCFLFGEFKCITINLIKNKEDIDEYNFEEVE